MVLEGYTEGCEWDVCLTVRRREKMGRRQEAEKCIKEKPLGRCQIECRDEDA